MDQRYLPGVVEAVKHKAGGSAMVLSKGVGIHPAAPRRAEYAPSGVPPLRQADDDL